MHILRDITAEVRCFIILHVYNRLARMRLLIPACPDNIVNIVLHIIIVYIYIPGERNPARINCVYNSTVRMRINDRGCNVD